MSDAAFRIYKIFAAVLCVIAIAMGGFLGWKSRSFGQNPSEPALEPIVLPTQTTVPETAASTESQIPDNLTAEEKILWAYFEASPYSGGTCFFQDLDGNGIPELLIQPSENIYEVVTVVNGEVVPILSHSEMFLCEGNTIGRFSEGSGGCTVWYYEISGSEAEPLVCLVLLYEKDTWYNSPDFTGGWDTMTPITEEEKNEILSKYLPVERNYSDQSSLHFLYQDILNRPIANSANE